MNITRATGWDREYILWELPLAHGLQIQHAEAIFQGETMEWEDGAERERGMSAESIMKKQFQAMRGK